MLFCLHEHYTAIQFKCSLRINKPCFLLKGSFPKNWFTKFNFQHLSFIVFAASKFKKKLQLSISYNSPPTNVALCCTKNFIICFGRPKPALVASESHSLHFSVNYIKRLKKTPKTFYKEDRMFYKLGSCKTLPLSNMKRLQWLLWPYLAGWEPTDPTETLFSKVVGI